MKKILVILFILLPFYLFSEIELKINRTNVLVNEIVELEAAVPGNDIQAPIELFIDSVDYAVIDKRVKERFSYNQLDGSSENSIIYVLKLIFHNHGTGNIQVKVKKHTSGVKNIHVSQTPDINSNFPYLHTEIAKRSLYVNEAGYTFSTMFDTRYIDRVFYTRPVIDLEANSLNTGANREIVLSASQVGRIKDMAAFSYYSDTPGEYLIAESYIEYKGVKYTIPEHTITIKSLPNDMPQDMIIGKNINVEIRNLKGKYLNRDYIEFDIIVKGECNLYNLSSLKNYFNYPKNLSETVISRDEFIQNRKMIQVTKFRYSGVVDGLTGITIPQVSIPFFNTEEDKLEYINFEKKRIPGTFPLLLIISFFIVLGLITAGLIVFSLKIIKRKKRSSTANLPLDKIPEGFNFSKRESEIFMILINGKSTKEIADELYISTETVKKHIQSILKKTDTKSRLELIAMVNSRI